MRRPTRSRDEDTTVDSENENVQVNLGGEIPVVRWKNRRKMAWWAFYAILSYTLIYWFALPLWFQWFALPTTWLDIIGESFFWFAITMSSVILGYMGFTTMPFMGRNKNTYKVDEEDY